MKKVKFLIVAAIMVMSVNFATANYEPLAKKVEELKYRRLGTIKFVQEAKGFGYVIDAENRKEYFFLIKDFLEINPKYKGKVKDLKGVEVEFEVRNTQKGIMACDVKIT